jgi:hypothetical protein
MAYNSAKIIG